MTRNANLDMMDSRESDQNVDGEPSLMDGMEDVTSLSCKLCSSKSSDENQLCLGKKLWTTGLTFFRESNNEVYFTRSEVQRHTTTKSAWLVVGDDVYDATSFIDVHPGGARSILRRCGGHVDCVNDMKFHSKPAQQLWKRAKIGKVCKCGGGANNFTVVDVLSREETASREEPGKNCGWNNSCSRKDRDARHFVFLPNFISEHII